MRIHTFVIAALVVSGFVLAGPRTAQADSIDYIDLTGPEFAAADSAADFAVTMYGIDLYIEPSSNDSPLLYWDNVDGLGVRSAYKTDEIEADEILALHFMSGPVDLDYVSLTDLFHEDGYYEQGSYQLNGVGAWTPFVQNNPLTLPSPTTNGEFNLEVDTEGVSSIAFKAPGMMYVNNQWQGHEYSVTGIGIYTVPEPGTLGLLGLGLAVNAAAIRRRRLRSALKRR